MRQVIIGLAYGRPYSAQHYSPLQQVTAENVGRLGLASSLEHFIRQRARHTTSQH